MQTLKVTLLNQYIGAIAIGYLIGRGIEAFIAGFMPTVNVLLAEMISPRAFSGSAWTTARISLFANLGLAVCYFAVAYLLTVWLYSKPANVDAV